MGWLSGLPWGKIAVGVGGSLLGNWLGNKSAKSAMQRSPEELEALRGGTGAASSLGRQGQSLFQSGMPLVNQGAGQLGQAGNYWQTLLGGNRAAMAQATAGPRGAITDQYRGAEQGLERSGLRGGIRDLATAELSRDRTAKISGLTTGVQPMAAEGLAGVGSALGGLGLGLTGQSTAAGIGAGNIWTNLLRAGTENRQLGQQAGQQTASAVGGGIWDLLSGGSGLGGVGATPSYGQPGGITSTGSQSGGGHWYDFFKKIFGRGGGGGGSGSPESDWWKQYLASGLPGGGGGNPGSSNHPPI